MKIIKNIVLSSCLLGSSLLASGHATTSHESHWTYSGSTGPSNWGHLKKDYSDCSDGKRQSPINIDTHNASKTKSLNNIFVNYGNVKLEIINNGHTIQVNSDGTSQALLGGKVYKLLQFHFHSLSEHTINGKHTAMEAHLVHQAEDGELAVIAVMIKKGEYNNFMQKIFKFMPKKAGGKTTNRFAINANDILPKDKSFYHYVGSLTTPPCTQIVQWYVLKEPITISSKQLSKFNSLYEGNFRPVQEIAGRKIISQ